MNYRIRYHRLAQRDLDMIAAWIIEHAGADVARRKLTEIKQTITDLAYLPHRGSTRDDIVPGLRAIPAARRAVIAFTIDDAAAEVHILTVTYGGADWVDRARSRTPQGEGQA